MSHSTPQVIVLDNLATQLKLFEVLRDAHDALAAQTNDPEIQCLHDAIIDLLEQVREKYTILLDTYQYHPEKAMS